VVFGGLIVLGSAPAYACDYVSPTGVGGPTPSVAECESTAGVGEMETVASGYGTESVTGNSIGVGNEVVNSANASVPTGTSSYEGDYQSASAAGVGTAQNVYTGNGTVGTNGNTLGTPVNESISAPSLGCSSVIPSIGVTSNTLSDCVSVDGIGSSQTTTVGTADDSTTGNSLGQPVNVDTGPLDTGSAIGPSAPDLSSLSSAQLVQIGDKEAAASYLSVLWSTGVASPCPDGCTWKYTPPSYYPSQPTPFYEGQGNAGKEYTCGPSATRNMVYAMTGQDFGEFQFEQWEGTSSSTGTATGNIMSTLNGHFSNWDTWTLETPSSPQQLVSYVATDTYQAKHGVVMNVQTHALSFWNGAFTRHYDLAYGYNSGASSVAISEEWNHPANGGIPYGLHPNEPAINVFEAIHTSPSHQIVF